MSHVLVTGGAGYIGSHTIVDLMSQGHSVVSIDNYGNSAVGVYDQIQEITGGTVIYYELDLRDRAALENVFEKHKFDAIIHFAALKSVGESVENPLEYYANNLGGMISLLMVQKKFDVPHFIFSSSCSVYGNAQDLPVTEQTPLGRAESPYARTKQIGEQMIEDVAKMAKNGSFVILRYFNPAGAHPSILIGESPQNVANNLVPVITGVAIGKRDHLNVFGSDYETRDGTCIRDYIHVMDLARAHTLAVQYLNAQKQASNVEVFNLGTGDGVSVLEAIHAFEKVSGVSLHYNMCPRRAGDVVSVYADYSKAQRELGWKPQLGIDEIMETAWKWEQKHNT